MLDLRLATGLPVYEDNPVKIRCLNPNHPKSDPGASLAVYPDNLHCFGCGWHRNDWDEALSLLLGCTIEEAVDRAALFESDGSYTPQDAAPRTPLVRERAVLFNRFLQSDRRERASWLLSRGLTWETINAQLLGHDGFRFTIPVFDADDNLLTVRYRKDDRYVPDMYELGDGKVKRNPKYTGTKGRNGLYLYGEHWLAKDTRTWAVICEGELDALRLWQEGVPSCSATNGARQAHKIPAILHSLFPHVRTLGIATDTDEAGEKAALATLRAAEELGLSAFRLSWLGSKDITEHLVSGLTLRDCLKGRLVNGNIRYA